MVVVLMVVGSVIVSGLLGLVMIVTALNELEDFH